MTFFKMKVFNSLIAGALLTLLIVAGCGGGGDGGGDDGVVDERSMRMGILQFRTRHNLQDASCLPDQCDLSMEEEAETPRWLEGLAAISDMAVLHWDREIPWLAFDEDPPQGVSRSDFYDGRLDAAMRSWIDAFADHFARMPSGYLAVSILNGRRDGLQECRIDESLATPVTGACPVVAPGTQVQFQYDPGSGPVAASFDLQRRSQPAGLRSAGPGQMLPPRFKRHRRSGSGGQDRDTGALLLSGCAIDGCGR
jgi:hypothetical protein